ncbi:UNC93-like protein MFSD11 [Panonychus citri]|uniref:UNC93-like protein MFSD11 n=1 Tax=Panonychus citri TaxID=50023 RepID=UPI0023077458|nr:UNC93-like protein MFSD11 [Panonychus citri]
MDSNVINLLIFSLTFLLVSIPLQTGTIIQAIVVNSINSEYAIKWDGYEWSGYTGLAVCSITTAILSWFTPSLIAIIGCKKSMIIGGIGFCLSYSVFLYPLKYGLIIASFILGFSASILWPAQGNYLALISDNETITRNTGVLWSFTNFSLVIGNLIVSQLFEGKDVISPELRQLIYAILIVFGLLGSILCAFIKSPDLLKVKSIDETTKSDEIEVIESPFTAFSRAIKMLVHKKVMLIAIFAIYTGLELTFFTGLYSTSVASTLAFGVNRKKYSGECGLLIGIGEVAAGIVFIITSKSKRSKIIVVAAYILYLLTFACVFVNLPTHSSIHETSEKAIFESSLNLALLCALLLGFCDGLYETQINEFIAITYKENSSAPFAIFVSLQALGAGTLFYLGNYIGLHVHLIILTAGATIGTLAFYLANKLAGKRSKVVETESKPVYQITENIN